MTILKDRMMAINEQPQEITDLQPENKPAPKKNAFLGTLAIIISVASIALAFYTLLNNQKIQNNLMEANSALSASMEQLNSNLSQAQVQGDTKKLQTQKAQDTIKHTVEALNKQVQTTLSQVNYKNEDWLLLKARYYLELAQINAHWGSDFNTSIALLLQSDGLLKQLNQDKVFTVKQAIAKEVASLKAVSILDTAGILSQLDAAQTGITSLSIQSLTPSITTENPTPHTSGLTGWRAQVQETIGLLGKLVVIRRDKEDVKPLITPLYESLLKESIRLNLQEAQWAVLNRNQAVFDLVLKQAYNSLNRSFNATNQNTKALLNQLTELQQIHITQELPEINHALPLLNNLIETKELLANPVPDSRKGEKQS
ncbi:MAG: uroporphyrinogen-III C-methyltransferase [Legionellales bacterium]